MRKLACKYCGGPADETCAACAKSLRRALDVIRQKLDAAALAVANGAVSAREGPEYTRLDAMLEIAAWGAKRARIIGP